MKNKLVFLFIMISISVQAQKLLVTGKVMYMDGKPYAGVKVSMVGVDQDVASSSGEFRINIPASFKIRVGDKIQLFIEEPNKNTAEYSVIIPNNPGLNPVIIKLNTTNLAIKQADLQMLNFSVADFYEEPYGQAFYKENGKIVQVRALPAYEHEIHSSPITSNDLLTPIGDAVREAYRVVLFNNGAKEKYLISDIRMKIITHAPLPDKYVINWKRKGIKKAITVDVQLAPEKTIYKSMKSDEYLELSPGESQIVQFNLKGGVPGIYTLQFEIDVLNKSGSYSKLVVPGKSQILIPDREIKTGVMLISPYLQEELSARILHMDDESFECIVKASNPHSIIINDLFKSDQFKSVTNPELVEQLVKKKMTADRDYVSNDLYDNLTLRSSFNSHQKGYYLHHLGRTAEAIEFLNKELETTTRPTLLFAELSDIYFDKKDYKSIHRLWNERGKYNLLHSEGYYLAAFDYYSLIGPDSLKAIVAEAKLCLPDSWSILTKSLDISGTAIDSLAHLTQYLNYFHLLTKSESGDYRKIFITVIERLAKTLPAYLLNWGTQYANKIPELLKFDIYNHINLWKFFPGFRYETLSVNKTNFEELSRSLLESGRVKYADSVLSIMLKDNTFRDRKKLLQQKGDLFFDTKKYVNAFNNYQEALSFTEEDRDSTVLEDLIVKSLCCLYELYKTSRNTELSDYAIQLSAKYTPGFGVKIDSPYAFMIDSAGKPLKSPYNHFALGFIRYINGILAQNTKWVTLGYACSIGIDKEEGFLTINETNSLMRNINSVYAFSDSNYFEFTDRMVDIYKSRYFKINSKLFSGITNGGELIPPASWLNRLNQAFVDEFLDAKTLYGVSKDSFFLTSFRDTFHLGLRLNSKNYVMRSANSFPNDEINRVKKEVYDENAIKKDIYFQIFGKEQTHQLHKILQLILNANEFLKLDSLREAMLDFVKTDQSVLMIYYWLSEIEAMAGNYSNALKYLKKIVTTDPEWEKAEALRKFCLLMRGNKARRYSPK